MNLTTTKAHAVHDLENQLWYFLFWVLHRRWCASCLVFRAGHQECTLQAYGAGLRVPRRRGILGVYCECTGETCSLEEILIYLGTHRVIALCCLELPGYVIRNEHLIAIRPSKKMTRLELLHVLGGVMKTPSVSVYEVFHVRRGDVPFIWSMTHFPSPGSKSVRCHWRPMSQMQKSVRVIVRHLDDF